MISQLRSILAVALCAIHVLALDPTVLEPPMHLESTLESRNSISEYKRRNIQKKVNDSMEFNCLEESVIWKVRISNDIDYKVSTNQIFIIQNLTVADEGLYSCYSNDRLIVEYNLTVLQPPFFTKKVKMPRLIIKSAGNMAQLKCRAAGNPTPTIRWLKDNKELNRRPLGEFKQTRWSLIVEDLVVDDKGNYTCIVCNKAGCIDFTYIVDVIERYTHKPIIKDGYPENVTALVNSTVRFECLLEMVDVEPFISWFYLNSSDDIRNGTQINQEGNAFTPGVLELGHVTYEDEGWYACVATNSWGMGTAMAYLTVVDVLTVSVHPVTLESRSLVSEHKGRDIQKKVTDSVEFNCLEENVKWKFRRSNNTDFQLVSINQTFIIQNLTVADEGLYSCYSNDKLIADYNLTVLQPPFFPKLNQMLRLIVKPAGYTAQLKCRAAGNPTPTIRWLKDDKELNRRPFGKFKQRNWSLTFEDLVVEDQGNYTCIVCNKEGCIDFTYIVDVIERYPHKPVIKDGYLKNVTVFVNSTVRFACPLLEDDWHPLVFWFYSNSSDDIRDGKINGTKEIQNTIDSDILEIANVTPEDEGWYICEVPNALGWTSSMAYLTVVDVLPLSEPPMHPVTLESRSLVSEHKRQDIQKKVNDSIEFNCLEESVTWKVRSSNNTDFKPVVGNLTLNW